MQTNHPRDALAEEMKPCHRFEEKHNDIIGIASSDQVQRQQQRDEPVRENTHLVLDTLASRLRSYHLIVGVESLVFQIIRTQIIYIQSIVCMNG